MMRRKEIFGLFLLCLLSGILSFSWADKTTTNKEQFIPILKGVDGKIAGPAARMEQQKYQNSPYYKKIDFYAGSPSKTLQKLAYFKTYQQTSDYTCGAACAVMAFYWFGITNLSEDALTKEMDIRQDDNPREDGSFGCTTAALAQAFRSRGFGVLSSADTQDKNGRSFATAAQFAQTVQDNIKNNRVMLTENSDWGGHWMVLIGYDDMGTDTLEDDILLFADPYDTTDHNQDGYRIKSLQHYFYEWLDCSIMPKEQRIQQYVTIDTKQQQL